jgi:hypothetical protein
VIWTLAAMSENSKAEKIERTGDTTFNVHHSDGSIFECKADNKKRLDKIPGCKPKLFSFGGIGEKKPLICDKCNKRVYRISYIDGQSLCSDCH